VTIAVITLGKSAGGVRVVITPNIGALISGWQSAGEGEAREDRRERNVRHEHPERQGENRSLPATPASAPAPFVTSLYATAVPISPPSPYAAKSQPPTRASSYRWNASTGSAAPSICPSAFIRTITVASGPISASRSRKDIRRAGPPESSTAAPACAPARTRGPVRNENANVAAST
jgi:hypothetical protein